MLNDTNAAPTQDDLLLTADYAATELSLWQALLELSRARSDHDAPLLTSTEHTVPANANICHSTTSYDTVPVISSGWAMSSVVLQDARQQILSFLLPGDIYQSELPRVQPLRTQDGIGEAPRAVGKVFESLD
jgi:hypothetical protein